HVVEADAGGCHSGHPHPGRVFFVTGQQHNPLGKEHQVGGQGGFPTARNAHDERQAPEREVGGKRPIGGVRGRTGRPPGRRGAGGGGGVSAAGGAAGLPGVAAGSLVGLPGVGEGVTRPAIAGATAGCCGDESVEPDAGSDNVVLLMHGAAHSPSMSRLSPLAMASSSLCSRSLWLQGGSQRGLYTSTSNRMASSRDSPKPWISRQHTLYVWLCPPWPLTAGSALESHAKARLMRSAPVPPNLPPLVVWPVLRSGLAASRRTKGIRQPGRGGRCGTALTLSGTHWYSP